jgi:hypothetical protein
MISMFATLMPTLVPNPFTWLFWPLYVYCMLVMLMSSFLGTHISILISSKHLENLRNISTDFNNRYMTPRMIERYGELVELERQVMDERRELENIKLEIEHDKRVREEEEEQEIASLREKFEEDRDSNNPITGLRVRDL